jgi:hypothetical protein
MEEPVISLSDTARDGPLLGEDSAGEDAAAGEGASIEEAGWTGLGEAGADCVERSDTGKAREVGVGARGGLVGQCITGMRGPVCMGTGTEATMSIRSTSEEDVASGCCN